MKKFLCNYCIVVVSLKVILPLFIVQPTAKCALVNLLNLAQRDGFKTWEGEISRFLSTNIFHFLF
jgi:hypothetical protein